MNRTRTRLTMLPVRESRLPQPEALEQAYKASFPEAGPLRHDAEESAGDMLAFRTPTAQFAVALVRAPIPWSDLSGPCDAAWYWPEAAESLRPQRGHLLVTATSELQDAITLMLSLTQVVAATVQASDALGVFLPGADQVHKPEDFVSEAEGANREVLPLYLWIRFALSEERDGSRTLCTSGLADLDLMEVEFPRTRIEPQTLMDRAFNIAHYLLDHGPVLAHGHTIGISTEEKFKVSHVQSVRGNGKLVYQLKQA